MSLELYYFIGSTLGIISIIKIANDFRKDRSNWLMDNIEPYLEPYKEGVKITIKVTVSNNSSSMFSVKNVIMDLNPSKFYPGRLSALPIHFNPEIFSPGQSKRIPLEFYFPGIDPVNLNMDNFDNPVKMIHECGLRGKLILFDNKNKQKSVTFMAREKDFLNKLSKTDNIHNPKFLKLVLDSYKTDRGMNTKD